MPSACVNLHADMDCATCTLCLHIRHQHSLYIDALQTPVEFLFRVVLVFGLGTTWSPKACKITVFWAVVQGFRPSFHILLGSRYSILPKKELHWSRRVEAAGFVATQRHMPEIFHGEHRHIELPNANSQGLGQTCLTDFSTGLSTGL